MGLQDRDYVRDEQPGMQLSLPQTFVMRVLLVTLAVYVVQLFTNKSPSDAGPFTNAFVLTEGWWRAPWNVYRLLSYGFLHSPNDLFHVGGNMFVLWMFGTSIEQKYGSREFLAFYLVSIVFAGLAWSIAESVSADAGLSVCLGASGGVTAVLTLFIFNFPKRTLLLNLVIPVPAWLSGVLTIGRDVLGAATHSGDVAFTAHLGGAAFAAIYFGLGLKLGGWLPTRLIAPKIRRGPKLRVHDPDADREQKMERELDRILKKIQDKGQESLTRREKKMLKQASREYQRRKP